MRKYIIGRVLQAIICILAIVSIVFFLSRLSGDPTYLLLGPGTSTEDFERIRTSLGLNRPMYIQYGIFIKNILCGDFGRSIFLDRPVMEIIGPRFINTLKLGILAFVYAMAIGIPLGVYAAMKRNSPADILARFTAAFGQSAPPFWLGLLLVMVFSVHLGILPAGGKDGPESYILPSITLGFFLLAGITRMTRSAMLEILDSEYIKLARIKGLSERVVMWRHAFRNAMLPILTFAAIWFAVVLAGSVSVETVFAWPGIGQLVIQSVTMRDFPLTQAIVILFSALYIFMNLITDILYAYINPKIRYTR